MTAARKAPTGAPPSAGVLAKYAQAYAREAGVSEGRVRATKDIDVVLQHPDADLARTLERALTGDDYQGFSVRRKGEPLLLDNGTVNLEFAVSYRGGAWTSVTVDIARAEPGVDLIGPPLGAGASRFIRLRD